MDYGPSQELPVHDPPRGSSPLQPKRLKLEDPPTSPGPDSHPGASSSGNTEPILPIADTAASSSSSGPVLPISQPTTVAQPEKKDESDGDDCNETKDYQVSLYTSLTADPIENPKLLRTGCGNDEHVFLEIKQKLDDLEELINEGLNKFHYEPMHSK